MVGRGIKQHIHACENDRYTEEKKKPKRTRNFCYEKKKTDPLEQLKTQSIAFSSGLNPIFPLSLYVKFEKPLTLFDWSKIKVCYILQTDAMLVSFHRSFHE